MTADIIGLAFLVGAVASLVLLWRRGPQRRRAFYALGLAAALASFVLAATLDEVERRDITLPDFALPELNLLDEGPRLQPAALAELVGEQADAHLPHALELALLELPDVESCRERFNGMMRPATLVVDCRLTDDTSLRVARYDSGRPRAWFKRASKTVDASRADEADASCRDGGAAKGTYRDGEFMCLERGIQSRVAWTDADRRLGGLLVSSSQGLDELYVGWRDGEAE